MIISIHLPKTAGSSFASSLNQHFGNTMLKDYSDLPLHKSALSRNKHAIIESYRNYSKDFGSIKCIHGHFLPLKYQFHKTNKYKYVTWLREPSERLASQYFYMKRHYTPEKASKQSLLKKLMEENWSLEKFCLSPELKNTYSKFLWGFPIRKLNFIGIVEDYDNELKYFSDNILDNKPLTHYKQNTNPQSNNNSYFTNNPCLKNKILKYHNKDYCLYKLALEQARNQGRLIKHPPTFT